MGAETDKECRERADAATCKNYVSSEVSLPRVLLFHYADDPVVNCQMSRDLYDCLAKTDDTRAHYYELKGYQNSSLIFWNVEFVNAMSKFITSCSMQTAEQYSDSIMDITPKERHVLSVIRKHPGLIGPLSLRGLESFLGGYQCAWLHMNYNINILFIPDNFTISQVINISSPEVWGMRTQSCNTFLTAKRQLRLFLNVWMNFYQ